MKKENAQWYLEHLGVLGALSKPGTDPHKLYASLRRIERREHRLAELACNGFPVYETEEDEQAHKQKVAARIKSLLPLIDITQFFINGDPRGYLLKVSPDYAKKLGIYQDWGRYGILAPEF
jgi:hypothetical protein